MADNTMTDGQALSADGVGGSDERRASQRPLVPSERQVAAGVPIPDYQPYVDDEDDNDPLVADIAARAPSAVGGFFRRFDPRTISGPKVPLFVFVAMGTLTQVDDQVQALILPEISAEFARSGQIVLVIGTILGTLQTLISPLWGMLADRLNRVRLLRFSVIAGQIGSIAQAFSGSFTGIILWRSQSAVLTHPSTGIEGPARATLLADYYRPSSLAQVMMFLPGVSYVASIAAPFVAGWLINVYGWRIAIFVLGIIAMLGGLTSLFLREPRRGAQGDPELMFPDRSDRERYEEDRRRQREIEKENRVPFWEALRNIGGIETVRGLWMAAPFSVLGSGGIYLFFQLFWAYRYGLDPAQRGLLASGQIVISLFAVIGARNLAGRLVQVRPGRLLHAAGSALVLQGVLVFGILLSPWLWLSLLLFIPFVAGQAFLTPARDTIGLLVVPARVRGLGLQSIRFMELPGQLLFSYAILTGFGGASGPVGYGYGFAPFLLIGGLLTARASRGVDRDIRRARAVTRAETIGSGAKSGGGNTMLVCSDVDVSYDGTQVLFGVDLTVDDGEMVAVLGTNGAGKSTLLRAIAGLQHASNGAVFFDGADVTHEPAHRNAERGVVMMPGGHATFPTLTVRENLKTAGWLRREEQSIDEGIDEVLTFFPALVDKLEQVAGNLSGGEQQMVALGQAFLMRPRLLMIDELSLGLAPVVVERLLEILRAIHARGTTVLLVEQSVNVALTVAERAIYMEKGEIRFDGATADLLAQPELVRSVFMGGAVTAPRHVGRRADGDDGAEGLSVEDVSVAFGGVQALDGVDLVVRPGKIVGIIGPNGAGKTTLFDVISGFVPPDEGSIELAGRDISNLPPDARARFGLGRSFQNVRLFPALTVRENVAVALERRSHKSKFLAAMWAKPVRRAEARIFRRVDGLIEILGLEAFADKFAGELSTGSRRAVEVACIMASEPKILLLDEPSSGLAQAETEELGAVLERLVKEIGCGLVVIEHDLPLITSISDVLVAMDLGRLVAEGPPADVCNHPAVLRSYLAASESVLERSGRAGAISRALGLDADRDGGADPSDLSLPPQPLR